MAKEEEACKMFSCCPKCMHVKILVLGLLIILNAKYAWLNWAYFIGILLLLKGLIGLFIPKCPHCK